MIGKISRNWKAGHYAGEMVSQRRHRILAGPGTVLLLAYVLMFQFAGSVHAQSVTLAWDANTDPNLAGYRVYRSQQSGVYSSSLNGALLTAASFTDSTVQAGRTYYYVVTAIST